MDIQPDPHAGHGTARELRAELAMRNNIAVVKIHRDVATVWEKAGGDWIQATVANGLHEPGNFAISGSRILAGSSGCENDGVIYEKSSAGSWVITGRIAPDAGVCADKPRVVELNYDYAFIRNSPTVVRSYRKNGSALAWPADRTIKLRHARPSPEPSASTGSRHARIGLFQARHGLELCRAAHAHRLRDGSRGRRQAIYRDGVVVTGEGWDIPITAHAVSVRSKCLGRFRPRRHPGRRWHLSDYDISGKTIVAAGGTDFGFVQGEVSVYVLPSSLIAPPAIANNFDARNVSGFTLTPGSGFALAGNSSNYYFQQTVAARDTAAVYNDTDWTFFQGIEADVTPISWDLSASYSGVAVRYVDDNNFYFAAIRSNGDFELGRKLNGATTILAHRALDVATLANHHIDLSIWGSKLYAYVDGQNQLTVEDASLTHGSAALVTHRARANFDNTYVKPTAGLAAVLAGISRVRIRPRAHVHRRTLGSARGRPATIRHQRKRICHRPQPADRRSDHQGCRAPRFIRLDQPGLLVWPRGSYIDPQNYYYLSVRSSNSLQIRKVVNGVGTVLKAVTFTVAPGDDHSYQFEVRGNELSATVDGVVLARAIDNSLTSGQVGFATYRAGASYSLVSADQP